MRTNRLADARAALKHLPAESATPAEVHRLSAWLASACGDIERERRELASLIAEAPEDFEALERLETLEPREAAKTVAAELRRRRAEIERAPGAISRALSAQSAGARCRGDGPPGRTAGPSLRGDRLPDRRAGRRAGPRRPARGPPSPRGGRPRAGRRGPKLVRQASDRLRRGRAAIRDRIAASSSPVPCNASDGISRDAATSAALGRRFAGLGRRLFAARSANPSLAWLRIPSPRSANGDHSARETASRGRCHCYRYRSRDNRDREHERTEQESKPLHQNSLVGHAGQEEDEQSMMGGTASPVARPVPTGGKLNTHPS